MRNIRIAAAIVVVLGVGGSLYYGLTENDEGGHTVETPPPAPPQAVEVAAFRLQRETAEVNEELPGRTEAYEIAEVRPQVNGIIVARLFEEGSRVEEGRQLYQIDAAPYEAVHERAQADLQKAQAVVRRLEAKYRRYEGLVKIDAVSHEEYEDIRSDLEQAEADVAIAEAALSQAEINLQYTKVYAPISGWIGKSLVTKGALATANQAQPLAVIAALDPIYVDIAQSSAELMRRRRLFADARNLPVALLLEDGERVYEHEGRLLFHEVTVEPTTGTVKLRALFPNPDRDLLPGLFVRARLKREYNDALLIPQKAAERKPDGSLAVWVVDEDFKAQPVRVDARQAVGNSWLVEQGLEAGDVIVTEGQLKLEPGAEVRPVFPAATASAADRRGGE